MQILAVASGVRTHQLLWRLQRYCWRHCHHGKRHQSPSLRTCTPYYSIPRATRKLGALGSASYSGDPQQRRTSGGPCCTEPAALERCAARPRPRCGRSAEDHLRSATRRAAQAATPGRAGTRGRVPLAHAPEEARRRTHRRRRARIRLLRGRGRTRVGRAPARHGGCARVRPEGRLPARRGRLPSCRRIAVATPGRTAESTVAW
mmetsp:Transcript_8246/g.21958  ORF Transcript_8246/g.21958 Transcript_8246/m.21958 type:complete len:204 (+) Transcript_8246:66-677(+)